MPSETIEITEHNEIVEIIDNSTSEVVTIEVTEHNEDVNINNGEDFVTVIEVTEIVEKVSINVTEENEIVVIQVNDGGIKGDKGDKGDTGQDGNDADVTEHENAPDPHPQYIKEDSEVEITNDIGNPIASSDTFTNGETLADQNGNNDVLTFTFASPMQLIWVRADGGDVRVNPFGGTPTASNGIKCEDGIPNPLTINAIEIKVYAPSGVSVNVYGYRY